MNLFIGLGKIFDVKTHGKILKFNFSILQEESCIIPCIVLNPTKRIKKGTAFLESSDLNVWMQGTFSCYEFEYQGAVITRIVLFPFILNKRETEAEASFFDEYLPHIPTFTQREAL